MAQEGSTSIQQLQTNNEGGNSREVVQEILNEIEDKNNNMELSQAQQQYHLDPSIQQNSFAPKNEQEAQMMQQQMMEQQMMEQQNIEQQHLEQQHHNSMMNDTKNKSFTQKIFDMIKSPLIVFAVLLLLLLAPTKQLLQKIPKALSQTGNVTFVGNSVIALLGALLFMVVQFATQKLM